MLSFAHGVIARHNLSAKSRHDDSGRGSVRRCEQLDVREDHAAIAALVYRAISLLQRDSLVAVVEFIREHGKRRTFGRSRYVYLDVDGFTYWTMGSPIDQAIILNRAELQD